jgi:hypothetical protein
MRKSREERGWWREPDLTSHEADLSSRPGVKGVLLVDSPLGFLNLLGHVFLGGFASVFAQLSHARAALRPGRLAARRLAARTFKKQATRLRAPGCKARLSKHHVPRASERHLARSRSD